jgi:hypothetical protein
LYAFPFTDALSGFAFVTIIMHTISIHIAYIYISYRFRLLQTGRFVKVINDQIVIFCW